MSKVMLIYPPGPMYQRGEERCQSNIGSSTSTSMRACNDLGYCAAVLKKKGHELFLRDYQSEDLNVEDLLQDFRMFVPDFVFISTTNATIFDDIKNANNIKKENPKTCLMIKGALFFDIRKDILKELDLDSIDYLIGGEPEFIIDGLIDAHLRQKESIADIPGILYKKGKYWKKTSFSCFAGNLDSLPFPDRSLMKNELYTRPDTCEPQATITVSRGCTASCIYCLTPVISGRKIRKRSPQNILIELKECYHIYGIRDFFFKSDTFTMDRRWVIELCSLIMGSELFGKIRWVANSRTKPVDQEMLRTMQKSGCWLIAFGFESGSKETLELIKKGIAVKDHIAAVKMAKEAGLKIYGFFMIGFPWERKKHLLQTKKLMFMLDCDFVEMHLAIPYYGTELYDSALKYGLIDSTVLGKDYFNATCQGTKYISMQSLIKFRKKSLLQYHLRPSYLLRRFYDILKAPNKAKGYVIYGFKLLSNSLKRN